MQGNVPCLTGSNKYSTSQANGLHQLRRYVKVQSAAGTGAAAEHHVQRQQQQPQLSSPPAVNYSHLLRRHKQHGCPALLLAPMENLADRPARIALKQAIGELLTIILGWRANVNIAAHTSNLVTQAVLTKHAQVSSWAHTAMLPQQQQL
eukprot:GHRQ01029654.1.p1 GENE.GHRQ01029654.1~~GHRQ01029654.1.p1  ORF type:complete len:149 (+),score=12.13 GHRQ01029654.1:226-672(+)